MKKERRKKFEEMNEEVERRRFEDNREGQKSFVNTEISKKNYEKSRMNCEERSSFDERGFEEDHATTKKE